MAYKTRASKKSDEKETTDAVIDSDADTKAEEFKESGSKERPKLTSAQWWRAKELERKPHEILDNVIKQIEDDQQGRYEAYREYERLFGASVGPNGDDSFRFIASDELSQNELQNTLETLWAQIFKNRVVPGVSASEADWDEWDRARSYSRWLEGAFDEAEVYEEAFPQAGIHMLVHGTGIIRVGWKETEDDDVAKITSWAVNPRYAYFDRLEAKHGKPRSMYFKDHRDRYELFDTYSEDCAEFYGTPEERKAGINKATANDDLELGTQNTNRCDMITVREAYHLPSGPKAKDGRHVLWIKDCTLVDESFDWDVFPCVLMRFGARMEGVWGESAVKRIAPTQKLLDKLNVKIDSSQDVMGVPRILVAADSGIKVQHIDDVPGGIIQVNNIGQVKEWNAQCVTPELYQERDGAPGKMRALLGISDFEASSQLPAGLRDVGAPFMEHFVEQGQARHAMDHAEYENAVVKLAYLYMRQAEDLQEMGYDVVARSPGEGSSKSSIESLKFKDVMVDRKRLKLRVQPMSQLPQSFAGKVDAFEKLQKAGYPIDQKTVLRMMEVPDLAGATDMLVSDEEIIMKNLSYMVKTGEYLAPMPFDNLDLIVQLTVRFINRYRVREGRDLNKIGLLAQYIDDAIALKSGLGGPNQNAPPSVSGALGMGGPMPPGMPTPGPPGMAGPMGPPQAGPPGGGMPPGAPMAPQAAPQLGMTPPPQLPIGPQGQ